MGRYAKYKKLTKLPSGSATKKIKQYYLAEHLNFLDNFLKSRQSKGNITEVETAQEEEQQNSEDEQLDDSTVEERDATQDSAQDANLPTTGDTSKASKPAPIPPTLTTEQKKDNGYRKRKTPFTSLSDVNSSAFKYFETKQRLLNQTSQKTSTEPDPDLAFLHSILPDMKAMDARQKRQFKIGVMKLADETLNNVEISSVASASTRSSASTFNYTSPSVDRFAPNNEAAMDFGQTVEEEGDFNIKNYLYMMPK
ncbi:uncharacterized protein LOC124372825 [Homalodisca vitripennis]|uniref:uncharacterized protein LOC124372825 n=1 Tax=Homalodisca vitripennis TaxID=197043 RepID=UPI001EEBE3D2|nr:uncharacterized protein LOC124372825 [Homalodisca vitripennis]